MSRAQSLARIRLIRAVANSCDVPTKQRHRARFGIGRRPAQGTRELRAERLSITLDTMGVARMGDFGSFDAVCVVRTRAGIVSKARCRRLVHRAWVIDQFKYGLGVLCLRIFDLRTR